MLDLNALEINILKEGQYYVLMEQSCFQIQN